MNVSFINPYVAPRLGTLSAPPAQQPPAQPAPPQSAPSAPVCSKADYDQIQRLRNSASTNRYNGTVLGVTIGAMAAMVGVGGSVTGAVIMGGLGAIGVVSCLSQARMLEQQAKALEQRCGGTHP